MNLKPPQKGRKSRAAITLVEILVVVVVVGILASALQFVWGGLSEGTRSVQLQSHVRMLNGSIDVYVANGGSLEGVADGEEVLAKLKTVAASDSARKLNGYRGATVDVRLRGVWQTAIEAAGSNQRARWNGVRQRFEIVSSGAAGFKRFVTDLPAVAAASENREATMELASTGGWIWDYDEFGAGVTGPDALPVFGEPDEGEPPAGETDGVLTLNPPSFSIPGGSYEYHNFDLRISFENPNPPGASEIFYSIDNGAWELFADEPITVGSGQAVAAYAVTLDPDNWNDSAIGMEAYESTFVITGSTSGLFSNPVGGPDMVTGGWGNYFTWGSPATNAGYTDPSWILYSGASFLDVMPGERFLLGSIEYYNGTIVGGTGATGLDLSITLSFAGGNEDELFEYDLNLLNSPNLPGNSQAESADYVQFGDIGAEIPATLGGIEYTLVLEFGETSENGFSTLDEFFVYEGESAIGELYGTLVPAWGGESL